MTSPTMQAGYCFETADDWQRARMEDGWDLTLYGPKGGELWVGTALINGSSCNVWECPDGNYRAQLRVLTG